MIQCWRCGVDFDPAPFIPGAPCPDCQLYEPPNEWVKFKDVIMSEAGRIQRHIERLWKRRYSDREIGEALGLGRSQVRSIRANMGLPAHQFKGDEKWRDPEAVREQIGSRMRGNHYRQGKKA